MFKIEESIELGRIRDEAFDFLLGLVTNGFHAHYVPGFPGSLVDQNFSALDALLFGHALEKLRGNENAIRAAQRRHQHHARGPWLVSEQVPRSDENEQQDQANYQIVLPGSSGEFPKEEPSSQARDLYRLCSALCHLPEV